METFEKIAGWDTEEATKDEGEVERRYFHGYKGYPQTMRLTAKEDYGIFIDNICRKISSKTSKYYIKFRNSTQ